MCSTDYPALDNAILANIDLLTNLIIKLSSTERNEQKKYLEEINDLLNQTSPLLLQMPDARPEFLAQMYKQLILQKLPCEELSNNFAGLKEALEKIYPLLEHHVFPHQHNAETSSQVLEEHPIANCSTREQKNKISSKNPEQTAELNPELNPKSIPDSSPESSQELNPKLNPEFILEKIMNVVYPQRKVNKDYYLHNIKLDYYLPEKKMAVIFASLPHRTPTGLKLLSHKTGIKLVEIHPEDLKNLSLLTEKLSGSFR